MAEFVDLNRFGAQERHYHIYRIRSTYLDHQSHYHNYYQICFVVSGELQHIQQSGAVRLSAGDAFLVPPGFVHALTLKTPGQRSIRWLLSGICSAPVFLKAKLAGSSTAFMREIRKASVCGCVPFWTKTSGGICKTSSTA